MTGCACCSGHHPHVTSSRYGAYGWCACGWRSQRYRTRLGASLAWAGHIRDLAAARVLRPHECP